MENNQPSQPPAPQQPIIEESKSSSKYKILGIINILSGVIFIFIIPLIMYAIALFGYPPKNIYWLKMIFSIIFGSVNLIIAIKLLRKITQNKNLYYKLGLLTILISIIIIFSQTMRPISTFFLMKQSYNNSSFLTPPSPSPTPTISDSLDTSTPDEIGASWKTYTNEKYGFEFKYPSDFNFEKEDTKNPGTVITYFKHKNYNADQKDTYGKSGWEAKQFSIKLEKSNLSTEEHIVKIFDLKEFKIGVFKNFELGKEPYSYPKTTNNSLVDEIQELRINGKKFIVVHIPGAASGDYFYFLEQKNGIIASSTNGYPSYIENFDQILSTFRFTQ